MADILTTQITNVREGVGVLKLCGEIDMGTCTALTEGFEMLAGKGLTDVIIDASEVSFMDSTGVHRFVDGKRTIHESGGRLFLVASAPVIRVLDLAYEGPLFAARFESVEDALAAIALQPKAAS